MFMGRANEAEVVVQLDISPSSVSILQKILWPETRPGE